MSNESVEKTPRELGKAAAAALEARGVPRGLARMLGEKVAGRAAARRSLLAAYGHRPAKDTGTGGDRCG